MLSTTTTTSGESPGKVGNFTMTTQQLINSPTMEKMENGGPWLGSPIQRSSAEVECEYYDCDTDLSGLGISLKQLKLQPPAAANVTFSIEDEEFVEPHSETDEEFTKMLKIALQAQELEFKEKIEEKDALIKTLKAKVEQQKLKSEKSTAKVTDYERKVLDRFNELRDLSSKLEMTIKEKEQAKEDCKELLQDVNLCEDSFSLLHKNYEKVKVILDNFNKNEQLLNARYEQMRRLIETREKKIECIKTQTEEKITMAGREYEEKLREVEGEQIKLKAMICMSEVQIRQLEAGVTQKTREVEQLRQLCEELIKGKNC